MMPPPPTQWRLIWSHHLPAADNMAVDEAIFEHVAAGDAPPTLRIYGWEPPGVSLGYFQSLQPGVDRAAVRRYGYGLVRRPTGGRAIIHHHEVTYSVCIRIADLAAGSSVLESYRAISRGIEQGLACLGVPARLLAERRERGGPSARPAEGGAAHQLPTVCFAKAAAGDMVVEGRKIVGSAQMRRNGAILQHGSIPIRIDLQEHLDILGAAGAEADGEQAALRRAAVGVADALGRDVPFEDLGRAVVVGFTQAFGVELPQQELAAGEQSRAAELVLTKYGTEAWNETPGRRG